MSGNGKGDDGRPMVVPKKVYDQNHENTFGKHIPWWERRKLDATSTQEPSTQGATEDRKQEA